MLETFSRLEVEDLQQNLRRVQEHLAQKFEPAAHLTTLRAELEQLNPADVAYILEALPLEERLVAWDLVKAEREGEILLEVSEAVRESLIATMDSKELVAAAETLEADEIADLAPDLPEEVVQDVIRALPQEERVLLRAALSYEEGTVGALMEFDQVTVREDVTLEAATRYLRALDELPAHTDQLFVIDRAGKLRGTLPLAKLIVSDLERAVGDVMVPESVKLRPEDRAEDAAQAFERYDLVSAPVVDLITGSLVGRVTVNAVVDHIREKGAESQLAEAGLSKEEDVFAPVWNSFRNRWAWLAINLVTAFIASRVIGAFEGSIEKLVALAALMPIVAGIGGDSGNQTITMIVRALALGQMQPSYWRKLVGKELGVATLNGVLWGGLLGVVTWVLYSNFALRSLRAWGAYICLQNHCRSEAFVCRRFMLLLRYSRHGMLALAAGFGRPGIPAAQSARERALPMCGPPCAGVEVGRPIHAPRRGKRHRTVPRMRRPAPSAAASRCRRRARPGRSARSPWGSTPGPAGFAGSCRPLQGHRNAARAERLAEFLVATGDRCAAEFARARLREVVSADVVPVAHHQRLFARRAVGGAAFLVVHVAGVHILQSG